MVCSDCDSFWPSTNTFLFSTFTFIRHFKRKLWSELAIGETAQTLDSWCHWRCLWLRVLVSWLSGDAGGVRVRLTPVSISTNRGPITSGRIRVQWISWIRCVRVGKTLKCTQQNKAFSKVLTLLIGRNLPYRISIHCMYCGNISTWSYCMMAQITHSSLKPNSQLIFRPIYTHTSSLSVSVTEKAPVLETKPTGRQMWWIRCGRMRNATLNYTEAGKKENGSRLISSVKLRRRRKKTHQTPACFKVKCKWRIFKFIIHQKPGTEDAILVQEL